jgi:hypothetical protein
MRPIPPPSHSGGGSVRQRRACRSRLTRRAVRTCFVVAAILSAVLAVGCGGREDDASTTTQTSAQVTTSSPATTSSAVSAAKTVAEIQAEPLADLEAGRDPEVVGEIQLTCDGSGPVGFGDVVTCTPVPFTPSGGLIQSADYTVVVVEAR